MSLKYPEIFGKVAGITHELMKVRETPTKFVGSGTRVWRSIDRQYKGNLVSALDARRIWNHHKDMRWNGEKPKANGSFEKGIGGLYLSEGMTAVGKEAIFYAFKGFAQQCSIAGEHLNDVIRNVDEDNIFSQALPIQEKIIYSYALGKRKRCANLDPLMNPFVKELCSRLDKDHDVRAILRREGHRSSEEMIYRGDDYSLSRAVGTPILESGQVDGLLIPSARDYLSGDEGNILLTSETSPDDERVDSLIPKQKTVVIPNTFIKGADHLVVLDLHPVSGAPIGTRAFRQTDRRDE